MFNYLVLANSSHISQTLFEGQETNMEVQTKHYGELYHNIAYPVEVTMYLSEDRVNFVPEALAWAQ